MNKQIYIILLSCFFLCTISLSAQKDSTTIFYNWNLDNFYNVQTLTIDTGLEHYQIYNIARQYSYSNTFLGNNGQAFTSNLFYKNNTCPFVPMRAYYNYTFNPDNNYFFNTRKQYTNISFFANTDKQFSEQDLKITHSQNVNQYLNFGIRYNLISSVGYYINQQAIDNSLSIFSSYKKNKFALYATYNINKFKIQDNGGLITDSTFAELVEQKYPYTSFLTNLQDASSILSYNNFSLISKYKLSSKTDTLTHQQSYFGELVYHFESESYRSKYLDSQSDFYSHYYVDTLETTDSLHQRIYTNSLYLKLFKGKKFNFLPNAMFGFESNIFNYYYRWDRIYDTLNTSTAFVFGLNDDEKAKHINWNGKLKYYFAGYNSGDISINGNIKFNFNNYSSYVLMYGSLDNLHPEISENIYYSNNYVWDTSFVSKTRSSLQFHYINPEKQFTGGIYLYNLSHYIYFDSIAMPQQCNSDFQVISLNLEKSFHLKHIHFIEKIVYQKSTNTDCVHIPDINVYHSTYFDFKWIHKVLYTQIGFDIFYYNSFFADAFMPATSVFYTQSISKTGNYPYVDVFANFKLKRARIFIKLEHVNSGLLDYNYFSAYKYPMYSRVFKFGISWNFYD